MITATVIHHVSDNYMAEISRVIQAYTFNPSVDATGESSELVRFEISNLKTSVTDEDRDYAGNADVMKFLKISLSCNSEDFDFSILNRGDMTCLDTINEIIAYEGEVLSMSDSWLMDLVVRNADDIPDNMFYAWFRNNDAVNPIGDVTMEIAFETVD